MDASDPSTSDEVTTVSIPTETTSGILRPIRKLVVFVLGMSVLIVGIAMILLPGPATVVIPAGLAILATEFVWAQRWLVYLKRRAQEVAEWRKGSKGKPVTDPDATASDVKSPDEIVK
ncbi:MAG: PGPGW domain-containing protein [Planctomycetota bacterium]